MNETKKPRILAVYYSQTGQLARVLKSVLEPLEGDDQVEVVYAGLQPVPPYPFPWPLIRFFDVFPECVYLDPPAIKPLDLEDEDFDLVVLGYQPWYLSPSLPMTGFMQSPDAARLLRGKPVITVIACRNMWLMAQEQMKTMIGEAGGNLIDNIALVDQGSPGATFITTPRWMLSGRKDPFLGLFPPAGVADAEVERVQACGERLLERLKSDPEPPQLPLFADLNPSTVDPENIVPETMGRRSFRIWGRLLRAAGPQGHPLRVPLLALYALFLGLAIATVVPLSILVRKLLSHFPPYRRALDRRVAHLREPYRDAK